MIVALFWGVVVAVISDSLRWPENVTVSVVRSRCSVRTVKPRTGTAETRHTPRSPKRTVACPPADSMVCTPAPPSQSVKAPGPLGGAEVAGGGAVLRLGRGVAGGDGFRVVAARDGEAVGVGVVVRSPRDGTGSALGLGGRLVEEVKTVGADRATSGLGRVDPTTKCTVSSTAVTLTAVQESHRRR